MTQETNSRIVGAFLLLLAVPMIWWTEYQARAEATYYPKMAFLGPFIAAIAVGVIVHAPEIPMRTMAPRDLLYALLGAGGGVFNLHRYGAFESGSAAKIPLLVGFAAAAVYVLYRQVKEWRRQR